MPKRPSRKGPRKAVLEDTLLMTAVTRYFKLAGVVSAVWFVGYFKFSVSWLWLLLVVYIWKERHTKERQYKTAISQQLSTDEKSVILARVEDLPSWVHFPDVERAEWVNKILYQLWPYIGEYVEIILRENVEPAIRSSLPAAFQSFKFSKIDLGDIPPRVGGVKVYSQVKRDEIYMDLEVNYSSDSNIAVSVKGINAGLKDLRLHGILRIVFKPLINSMPLIGGIQVFFLNNPELNFDLTSLANAFDLPGLSDILHSIIQEQIANFMVLPNRYPLQLIQSIDINKLRYPLPQGVIRVKILEAKDLKKADIGFTGKGKSDPYVVIRVGAKEVKTKVISNTVTPVWNQTFEMIVDAADGQLLYLDVFDEDPGSKDDDLGRVNMDLSKLRENSFADEWLPLEEVNQGMIHVQLTWLWLANDPLELDRVLQQVLEQNKEVDDSHVGLLLVFLDSARNLPRGKKSLQEPSPQATISVGQQKFDSAIKYNTIEPKWEENYRFLLRNPNYQNLEIELKDSKTKKVIGGKVIKLKELLDAEDMILDQKFHIKTSETDSYLQMRLCLRILTPTANPEWTDDQEEDDLLNTKKTEEIKQNGSSVDDQQLEKVPDTANGTASKPSNNGAVDSKPVKPVVEGDIVPVVSDTQESGMRLRKSTSGTGSHGIGRIQMTFRYSHQKQKLYIVIHKCSNLKPAQGDSKNLADPYVKLYLLPEKSSASKKRTKIMKDNLNPVFDETFDYSVSVQELVKRTLEVSVKNEVGMFSSSETMLGKVRINLASLDVSKAITEWFDLSPENEPKSESFETVV
ncbi:extended synaptotagmin-2-like isoform X2 [Biomphalaria glabrata]|uniref:Extended synaptotagmin-2-like isoform X1 n=1 Tax=Biomphalaria glabrata TaxID=6526 RepID=A0A9U8EB83_BIOGL|nr:extended synaptotagmin-2-like isoform X1 [Biomphalaria glabrata]